MQESRAYVLDADTLKAIVEKAAEDGARKALAGVGLHDEDAANDVRDLRQVMADWRAMKRGVLTALANAIVLGLLGLILAGAIWHLRRQQ